MWRAPLSSRNVWPIQRDAELLLTIDPPQLQYLHQTVFSTDNADGEESWSVWENKDTCWGGLVTTRAAGIKTESEVKMASMSVRAACLDDMCDGGDVLGELRFFLVVYPNNPFFFYISAEKITM